MVDPITYGIDDNEPPPTLHTNNHVSIPQSRIQLTEGQETVLLLTVNPLEDNKNFGIDIYKPQCTNSQRHNRSIADNFHILYICIYIIMRINVFMRGTY